LGPGNLDQSSERSAGANQKKGGTPEAWAIAWLPVLSEIARFDAHEGVIMKLDLKTALAAALFASAPALAARAEPSEDARHRGFFLRMHLGGGYLNSSVRSGPYDVKVDGGAGSFAIALGGAIGQNLHLYGELVESIAGSPNRTINGTSGTLTNTSYGLYAMGPGVNYYFMPINVYLSGSLLFSRLNASNSSGNGNSDWGLAGKFQLGKEWWVSDTWGLGVAGMLLASGNGAGGGSPGTFSTWSGAILFSATYN
jgi:hypothetical protein